MQQKISRTSGSDARSAADELLICQPALEEDLVVLLVLLAVVLPVLPFAVVLLLPPLAVVLPVSPALVVVVCLRVVSLELAIPLRLGR